MVRNVICTGMRQVADLVDDRDRQRPDRRAILAGPGLSDTPVGRGETRATLGGCRRSQPVLAERRRLYGRFKPERPRAGVVLRSSLTRLRNPRQDWHSRPWRWQPRIGRVPNRVPKQRPSLRPPKRRNPAGMRDCGWRDPDSNRGHHDFQSCGCLSRTPAKSQQTRWFTRTGARGESSQVPFDSSRFGRWQAPRLPMRRTARTTSRYADERDVPARRVGSACVERRTACAAK
jgi:hypothetical protein